MKNALWFLYGVASVAFFLLYHPAGTGSHSAGLCSLAS